MAKFYVRKDGPYSIIRAHPDRDCYVLEMPNAVVKEQSHYVDALQRYVENDDVLFPKRALAKPPPIMVDGAEEWSIKEIIKAHRRGRGWQFLVRWVGYNSDEDRSSGKALVAQGTMGYHRDT